MAPRMALCVRELMRVCHWWTAILWLLWIAYSIVAIDALYKRKTKFFRIRFIALSLFPLWVYASIIQIYTFEIVDSTEYVSAFSIPIFDLFSFKQNLSFPFISFLFVNFWISISHCLSVFVFHSYWIRYLAHCTLTISFTTIAIKIHEHV